MEKPNKEQQVDLEVELTDEIAEGIYANLAVIAHSSSEFVIDFIRIMPNSPKAKVKSRIVLTPENTKRLLMVLQDNINTYEQQLGHIKTPANKQNPPIPMGFGGEA